MKIERDEEEGIVIEISPFFQWTMITLVVGLLGIGIWKFVLWRQTGSPASATLAPLQPLPQPAPEPEPEPEGEALLPVEEQVGVANASPMNIERLSGADRVAMEGIYTEMLSNGTPDLQSEEAPLFRGMIEQSVRTAPNRSLRFYSLLDNTAARDFALENLFRFWFRKNFEEACEGLPQLQNSKFQLEIYRAGVTDLAERDPSAAFGQLRKAKAEWFEGVRPGLYRSLFRVWGRKSPDEAMKNLAELHREERAESVQGVALGRIDTGWPEAFSWAKGLAEPDKTPGLGLVIELGIQRQTDQAAAAISAMPGGTYRAHLQRSLEVKQRVAAVPLPERDKATLRLYRSHPPEGDLPGLACLGNALEEEALRDRYSRLARFRLPEFADLTFKEGSYCVFAKSPPSLERVPFQDLLALGKTALGKGNPDEARQHFERYLILNPADEEAHQAMTELAKVRKTWLGPKASLLEEVKIAPESYEDVSMREYVEKIAARVEAEKQTKVELFLFQAIVGTPIDTTVTIRHEEVTAKDAIDGLNGISGLTVTFQEFGVLIYGYRDQEAGYVFGEPREVD